MINVRVLFWGPAGDLTAVDATTMTLPENATLRALVDRLAGGFPKLAPALPTVRFAVNLAFATNEVELHDGDEVAVIPPVSGG